MNGNVINNNLFIYYSKNFINYVDIDPEDYFLKHTLNISGMQISSDSDEEEVEGRKPSSSRKHLVYQTCLLELFNLVCWYIYSIAFFLSTCSVKPLILNRMLIIYYNNKDCAGILAMVSILCSFHLATLYIGVNSIKMWISNSKLKIFIFIQYFYYRSSAVVVEIRETPLYMKQKALFLSCAQLAPFVWRKWIVFLMSLLLCINSTAY